MNLIDQIGRLDEEIKGLQAARALLVQELGELDVDSYPGEKFLLRVELNRRFDKVTARKNLTPEQYESILIPVPDSAKAKEVLGADYYLTQREYDPKYTFTRMED